jgi:protein-S-isoprenylcysteine O-methyltransferase Ste14
MLKSTVKFVILMFAMTIVSTIVWQQVVVEHIYDCTDDNMAGFLRPGDWVHFYHGVVYVPHVAHNHSMSDPDSIRKGWSMTGLWCLWLSFVAVSLAVAFLLARRRWIPGTPTPSNKSPQPTATGPGS